MCIVWCSEFLMGNLFGIKENWAVLIQFVYNVPFLVLEILDTLFWIQELSKWLILKAPYFITCCNIWHEVWIHMSCSFHVPAVLHSAIFFIFSQCMQYKARTDHPLYRKSKFSVKIVWPLVLRNYSELLNESGSYQW